MGFQISDWFDCQRVTRVAEHLKSHRSQIRNRKPLDLPDNYLLLTMDSVYLNPLTSDIVFLIFGESFMV